MKKFKGRVAAITGAGSGIGRALAQVLAAKGCHVAIADINPDALAETKHMIKSRVDVSTHVVDVGSRTEMEQFAAEVAESHRRVHMIFNNAGVSVTDTVEHMSYEDFEWLMNINFWGVVYGTKSFLPYLHEVDEAHIANTSSIFGTIALPTQSAYNASKFAVRGFTYALKAELDGTNIGVSCIQPGGVKTNIVRDSRYVPADNASPTREEFIEKFEEIARTSPTQAAEQIIRGIKRNRTQILVGRDARLASRLERLAPVAYLKLFGDRWLSRD